MSATRYLLVAGAVAVGFAATLPNRSGDKNADAPAPPAAVQMASHAAPEAFAVRSKAALAQAEKEGCLVMVAVNNAAAPPSCCAADTAAVPAAEKTPACCATDAPAVPAAEKVASCCDADGDKTQAGRKRFVNLEVNPAECPVSKAFAEEHNVTTYPTTLFLDAKGREVHRVAGELEPDNLVAAMDAALARAGQTAARG